MYIEQRGEDHMSEVFIVTFLMAFTFLLICWVVTQYQIYTNEHSMEEELGKPRLSSRVRTWRMMMADTLHSARYFKQETLRSENRTTFLFGTDRKNRKNKAV